MIWIIISIILSISIGIYTARKFKILDGIFAGFITAFLCGCIVLIISLCMGGSYSHVATRHLDKIIEKSADEYTIRFTDETIDTLIIDAVLNEDTEQPIVQKYQTDGNKWLCVPISKYILELPEGTTINDYIELQ